MKCPKCGGEIGTFDLRPNCKHCGVNIMYYTQNEGLMRDAKRTELESASARMVIARIKAEFIGGKLQIFRMIAVVAAVCALMVPFGSVHYSVPFLDRTFSVGLIGIIQSFSNGVFARLFDFLGSEFFKAPTVSGIVTAAFFVIDTIIALIILAIFILGFLKLTKSAKAMRGFAIAGAAVSAAAQIASFVLASVTANSGVCRYKAFFGGLVCMFMFLAVSIFNKALLKKDIEPQYRENDEKRKEMLKQYRKGELDLDSLPLPIFESEEEREERLKALEEALKAEEEGKEL